MQRVLGAYAHEHRGYGRPAARLGEVEVERGNHVVAVVAVLAEEEEREELERVASGVRSVVEDRRDARRCTEAVALTVGPEGEENRRRLARTRLRVEEREEELRVEPDARVPGVPVEGRHHVELGRPAVARVAPGDERLLTLLA